jgi:hypothetical protein
MKSLASLLVQLNSHVSKACTHVSKAPDVREIMGLQDVRTGGVINAYKTCGQVATVRLQYRDGPIDHSQDTATVPGGPTGQCHTIDRAQHGRTT